MQSVPLLVILQSTATLFIVVTYVLLSWTSYHGDWNLFNNEDAYPTGAPGDDYAEICPENASRTKLDACSLNCDTGQSYMGHPGKHMHQINLLWHPVLC